MRIFFVLLCCLPFLTQAEEATPQLGLNNESALGYVVSGGNSTAETFNLKQETGYKWTADQLKLTGSYLQTKAKSTTSGQTEKTAQNYLTTLRYEKLLSDSFNTYSQLGLSGDKFQGSKEKKTAGLGLKYYTIKTQYFEWFKELGYEYARELFTAQPNSFSTIHPEFHFLRLYTQADYAFKKDLKFGLLVEFLYPFADQRLDNTGNKPEPDYRINFSPHMTSILSDLFSLKVSYEGRYRNTPVIVGNQYLDFTFNTALLAVY